MPKYSPYHFQRDDAFRFAQYINAQYRVSGNELQFKRCPYCGGHTRDTHTFSINLETGQFNCLRASCGVTGNMITLSKDFDFSLGNEVDEYFRPKKVFRQFGKMKEIEPKPEALDYLESRGIHKETAKQYGVTIKTGTDNILVFPFVDDKNIVRCIKYRKTDFDKTKDKNKEWFEKDTRPILFGIQNATFFNEPLVVCEGQLDSLSVAQAGVHNAVSVPNGARGFTWFPYCWDWIHKFNKGVIIFGDHENGKITLLEEFSARLSIPVKHVRVEDYKDCKDANEILQKYGPEQVRLCVQQATFDKIEQIVDLADVGNINFYQWRKMKTGLPVLDRFLYGGIPFGGVTLIAGKPGGGKSTLASQIIAGARQDGKRILVYSGELTKELFKSWLNFQVAGSRHINTLPSEWGDQYGISTTNVEAISEWYRDHVYFYDYDDIGERSETKGIIKLLDAAIVRYGIDVVLIDNLMTALDLDDSKERDKYEKQSKFVKALVRLAKRHNIVCLLVAHQRKNNFSGNANDEISGSGDIANLAMITLSYETKVDDDSGEEYKVLKLAKNRLFGKLNTQGWEMSFDPRSRRIGMKGDDLNYEYGWVTPDEYGFVSEEGEGDPFEDD